MPPSAGTLMVVGLTFTPPTTKMSSTPLVSPVTRFEATDENATCLPSALRAA